METVDLTPDYVNVGKYMANVLKYGKFEDDHKRYEFSTEFQRILGYLKETNPDGWREVLAYTNRLADNG